MSPHEHAKQILFALDHPSVWKSVSVSIDSLKWDDREIQNRVLRELCSINTEELQITAFELARAIMSSCNLEHLKVVTATACRDIFLAEKVYLHCTNIESLRMKLCPCIDHPPRSYIGALSEIESHIPKLKRLHFDLPFQLEFWEFTSLPAGVPVMGQVSFSEKVQKMKSELTWVSD